MMIETEHLHGEWRRSLFILKRTHRSRAASVMCGPVEASEYFQQSHMLLASHLASPMVLEIEDAWVPLQLER